MTNQKGIIVKKYALLIAFTGFLSGANVQTMDLRDKTHKFEMSLNNYLVNHPIQILSPAPNYIFNMLAAGLGTFCEYAKDSADKYGLDGRVAKKIFADVLLEYVTYCRIRGTGTDFTSGKAFCAQKYGAAIESLINRIF